jgi:DNA-directed RNA polymerase specialized sigma24 family protein
MGAATEQTEPKTPAEKRLAVAAGFVAAAEVRRNEIILDTAESVTRRRAAELLGLSPGRVQQIINSAREESA